MTFHLDLPYLNYILDVIKDIEESIRNTSEKKFQNEKDIRDANIRRLDVIGESIKNLSDSFKERNPDIPWKAIEQLKDRITSKYFGVDNNILWKTIKEDIPLLKNQILEIIKDIKKRR
jgi:uncharacterized protein with HEPN domain